MTALNIIPPFPVFSDSDGESLENGFVYIGIENLEPITNPISVYWDESMLILASQPIRTVNGYPSRNGTPSNVFAGSNYSITVKNKKGLIVYTSLSVPNTANTLRSDLADTSDIALGDALVGVKQDIIGAVGNTQHNKNTEWLSVKDFGAKGDGITNDTAAINLAISASNAIFFPPGTYMTDGGHNITGKRLFGSCTETCIVKLRGTNTAGVMFRGPVTSAAGMGTWGTDGEFTLEKLWIQGNWDGSSGTTVVATSQTNGQTGVVNATGAFTSVTVSGSTLTLNSNDSAGTFGIGQYISYAGVTPGTIIIAKVSGVLGQSGSVYTLNQVSTSAVAVAMTSQRYAVVGILLANYDFDVNLALVKSYNMVRINIHNCRVSNSYGHGIQIYRNGYSLIDNNLIFANFGSGLWISAANASDSVTSTTFIANKIESNRGWYGNLRAKYLYGCEFIGGLWEAGNYNIYLEESADVTFTGGYSEAGTTADVYMTVDVWAVSFFGHSAFNPPVIPVTRGIWFQNKQMGIRYQPNLTAITQLGPIGFTQGSNNVGIGASVPDPVKELEVHRRLGNPAAVAYSESQGIRLAGDTLHTSNAASAEVQVEANLNNSTFSRIGFKTYNGTSLSRRSGISKDGSFEADSGAWDGAHLILGTYHLWMSSTGKLYVKNGSPSGDTDGTIVGTQS